MASIDDHLITTSTKAIVKITIPCQRSTIKKLLEFTKTKDTASIIFTQYGFRFTKLSLFR
jgi:hypothetical protein